eukprot:g56773.t1
MQAAMINLQSMSSGQNLESARERLQLCVSFVPVQANMYGVGGDIGGTYSRLQLLDLGPPADKHVVVAEKKYSSGEHKSLTDIIRRFLTELNVQRSDWPQVCCLAVAGPVLNGECKFTNVEHWPKLVQKEMGQELGIPLLVLMNDFESVGHSLLALKPGDYTVLRDVPRAETGVISCVGAGTGLGECLLAWNTKSARYEPFSSEGGHAGFVPQTTEQWRLREYIAKSLGLTHVSVERVVSGSGIVSIYNFLCAEHPELANTPLEKQLQEEMRKSPGKGLPITNCARKHRDGLAARAVRLFAECYGVEAGNMALRTLCFGGLYLAGGVAPNNLWALQENNRFVKNYLAKGRMQQLVEKIPVYVVHEDVQVGLLGAQVVCRRLAEKRLQEARAEVQAEQDSSLTLASLVTQVSAESTAEVALTLPKTQAITSIRLARQNSRLVRLLGLVRLVRLARLVTRVRLVRVSRVCQTAIFFAAVFYYGVAPLPLLIEMGVFYRFLSGRILLPSFRFPISQSC